MSVSGVEWRKRYEQRIIDGFGDVTRFSGPPSERRRRRIHEALAVEARETLLCCIKSGKTDTGESGGSAASNPLIYSTGSLPQPFSEQSVFDPVSV